MIMQQGPKITKQKLKTVTQEKELTIDLLENGFLIINN